MENLQIFGAFTNVELIGAIAARNDGAHIALSFVDENYHRQGIGKSLFQLLQIKPINGKIINVCKRNVRTLGL